ncbi:flagellar hook-associated protein FlgL [Halorhodospira neutriphila]|uniref:Flagellar hook-associated protein 3 n=1 Tax=Halorhodospira neutriphila TaxID=168379 RepID=A0ABS1E8X1_9GAMM|nr:flagellar hook-associated protein 3 [Halorhodospira neutriphila]
MRVSTNQLHNTSVQNMTGQQSRINETQDKLSSGLRVRQPSDDPTAAARALDLERAISAVERFNKNGDMARTRLSMSESALEQAGNNLQRIRELAVQAANGSQTPETREQIAAEVRERREQLFQLANSRDGSGEYLFAGSRTRTQPFHMTSGGTVEYRGDQNTREVRVGPGRQMSVDSSGFEVFMDGGTGNGHYQVREAPGNEGSGVIIPADTGVQGIGSEFEAYRVRFAEDQDGNLRYAVQRTRDADGGPEDWEWVQPPAQDGQAPDVSEAPRYEPGGTIEVADGVRVVIKGEPEGAESFAAAAPGDTFSVTASRPQSVFATVDKLATALEREGTGEAFHNAVNRALGDIDLAMENISEERAEIGARLSALDAEEASNEAALVDLNKALSDAEDLDYAEATGRFNQQLTGLQAAQSTFSRVQGLSLFKYL